MKLKEEIKKIYSLEGETFYLYFDGKDHYDEKNGKEISAPNFYYLDKDFNVFMGNFNKDAIGTHLLKFIKKGVNVKSGPHSPEIEDENGDYVSNTNKDTLGIWRITTPEEKNKYRALELMQKAGDLLKLKKVEEVEESAKNIPVFGKSKPAYLKKYKAFRN